MKEKEISSALLKRIKQLSQSTAPTKFAPVNANETIEKSLQREAEDSFQRALARRVWWLLSPKEQIAIRKLVLKDEWAAYDIESACTREVRELIIGLR